jgi:hypothetical protein
VDFHANTTVSDEYTATIFWAEDYFQHWKNVQENYEHLSNYNFTTENAASFFLSRFVPAGFSFWLGCWQCF